MAPRSFRYRGNLEHLLIMNMVEFAIVLPAFHPFPHISPILANCYEFFNFREVLSSFPAQLCLIYTDTTLLV